MKRMVAYTLIVLGLLIMLYPITNEYYENVQTQELLQAIENNADFEANDAEIDQNLLLEYQNASEAFEEFPINELETNNAPTNEETVQIQQKKVSSDTEANRSKAVAVIKIAKIKLNLPVLEGATNTNMKYAAAHLKETDVLGGQGNAAIAAHRAKTKGRLFNRLNEIEVGDEIVVEVGSRTYVYETDKISIVKPTDISVLKREAGGEAVLTLITCEPLVNPTHRLIVRAKLKEA